MSCNASPLAKYDVTIAICTYNGQSRLPEVLQCLEQQVVPEDIAWEVLIIDNNSSDETQKVSDRYCQIASYSLRYYFEAQQGLAFARQSAIEQAQGQWVAFIDDDNFPDPDWVGAAMQFARTHPQAGAYGGLTRAQLEGIPPEGFEEIAPFLAIVERGTTAFRYERSQRLLPPGAGLVVRRQAWLDCVPPRLFLTGREQQFQLASEDLEAIVYLQNAGWEIWYNPQMKLSHKIPAYRLERNYLLAIAKGTGLARYHIRRLRLTPWQKPLFFGLYFLNDLRQALWYYFRYRRTFTTDVAAACKMAFLVASLWSPWVLWRQSQRRRAKSV
ncbi:MAG: hormogonium polysaccharide biosynthesis glycosyltransferase HpsE [Spirulinaceae cyanobacterium]